MSVGRLFRVRDVWCEQLHRELLRSSPLRLHLWSQACLGFPMTSV